MKGRDTEFRRRSKQGGIGGTKKKRDRGTRERRERGTKERREKGQ